jgi:hypothetical protein
MIARRRGPHPRFPVQAPDAPGLAFEQETGPGPSTPRESSGVSWNTWHRSPPDPLPPAPVPRSLLPALTVAKSTPVSTQKAAKNNPKSVLFDAFSNILAGPGTGVCAATSTPAHPLFSKTGFPSPICRAMTRRNEPLSSGISPDSRPESPSCCPGIYNGVYGAGGDSSPPAMS